MFGAFDIAEHATGLKSLEAQRGLISLLLYGDYSPLRVAM
jgi:hypothetical protein